MTGVIERLTELIRGVAPDWTQQTVRPRGVSRYLDRQLRGTLRYGNRVGSHIPNIQAENTAILREDATARGRALELDHVTDDWRPGQLVRVAARELHQVYDVDRAASLVTLYDELLATHLAGETVVLYGEPVRIVGPTARGSRTVQVRSRWAVLPGDRLYCTTDPANLASGQEYRVVRTFAPYVPSLSLVNSSVELDQPLPRDLAIDDIVYLRVLPGYRSGVLDTPVVQRSVEPFGPFVLDYVSGRFTDQTDPEETLAVELLRFDEGPADPAVTLPVVVGKNTPVVRVSIPRTAPLFWHVLRGSVLYRTGQLVLRADERGRCTVWTDLLPAWPGPARWVARVRYMSGQPFTIVTRFWPHDQVARPSGTPGQFGNLAIELPSGAAATRLTLSLSGQPGAELEMGDLQYDGRDPDWVRRYGPSDEVERVRYSLSAQTAGPADWQAGSLQAKPYFQTIVDLRTHLDGSRRLDGGSLLL